MSNINFKSDSLIIIISEKMGGIFVTPKLNLPLLISPIKLMRKNLWLPALFNFSDKTSLFSSTAIISAIIRLLISSIATYEPISPTNLIPSYKVT